MNGIFISYRRSTSKHIARLIFEQLRSRGYDVFLDVSTIDSGAFDKIIMNQIAARPHFLLVLSQGSLERCINEGDWLRREIEEAFALKRNIVPIFDDDFSIEHEKQYLPELLRVELPLFNGPPYSHYYFDCFIDTLCKRFLKQPVTHVVVKPTSPAEEAEVQRRISIANGMGIPTITQSPPPVRSKVYDILPQPFEWIEIPVGKVTLTEGGYVPKGGQTFDVPVFAIAKYPITNAQFAKFIESGGYNQNKWWTDVGWQQRQSEKWTQPRYWTDNKWNGADYPVVGVSWYETIAFCQWLSEESVEAIMLPTEQQWQRAAQGDDGRIYPWGNAWNYSFCNNNINPLKIDKTSPVRFYEYSGTSPFGVVDMAGNVWEWCLTGYERGQNDMSNLHNCILRGGSWGDDVADYFRTDFRFSQFPFIRNTDRGFRIVRSLK